jgi:hypothetical protein
MGQHEANLISKKLIVIYVTFLFLTSVLPAYSYAQSNFATGIDNDGVILYYLDDSDNNKIQFWNVSSGAWSGEQVTNISSSTPSVCTKPNKKEAILISKRGGIYGAQVFNGSSVEGTNITFGDTSAGVKCAYESLSGNAVVVWHNATNKPSRAYRNWTGWDNTLWSSEAPIYDPNAYQVDNRVRLISNPVKNEIIYLDFADNYGSLPYPVYADIWNGSVWGNNIKLAVSTDAWSTSTAFLTGDCAYETISNLARCFWINATTVSTTIIGMATWDTNARQWVNQTNYTMTTQYQIGGRNGAILKAVANPMNNEIIAVVKGHYKDSNITALVWNGTAISSETQLNIDPSDSSEEPVCCNSKTGLDMTYRYFADNSTSTEALVVWADNASKTAIYSLWNGTAWTNKTGGVRGNATSTGAKVDAISLTTNINGQVGTANYWAFLATEDEYTSYTARNAQNFNGTTWSSVTLISAGSPANTGTNSIWIEWLRIDNSTPVFRSAGTNETDGAINASSTINLNATIRDNFQIDKVWLETNETGSFVNYTDGTRIWTNLTKSSFWNYVEIVWQNNSVTNGTIGYSICANDTNNNRACSTRREFTVQAAAVTLMQSNSTTYWGGDSKILVLPSVVTAGNLIVVGTVNFNIPTNITWSDNQNNVYAVATNYTDTASNRMGTFIYYLANAPAGIQNFTIYANYNSIAITVAEFSGVQTSSPFDKDGFSFQPYDAGTKYNATSNTTTSANELLVGYHSEYYDQAGATFTADPAWSIVNTTSTTVMQWRTVSATGNYDSNGTFAPASGNIFVNTVATFKAIGGLIAFDSTNVSYSKNSLTCNLSLTVGASGTNRILVVGVSEYGAGQDPPYTPPTIFSVSDNGVNMTKIRNDSGGNLIGRMHSSLWNLTAPATGANNIVVTFNNESIPYWIRCGAISLTGVDQTNPVDANNGAIGQSAVATVDLTTVTDSTWVVDTVSWGNVNWLATVGAGQTQRWNGYQYDASGAGSTEPTTTAGAVTMNWTIGTPGGDWWTISTASFKSAAAGGAAAQSFTFARRVT